LIGGGDKSPPVGPINVTTYGALGVHAMEKPNGFNAEQLATPSYPAWHAYCEWFAKFMRSAAFPTRADYQRGNILDEKICRNCLGSCSSTEETLGILQGESTLCVGCDEYTTLVTISEQYRSQRPRWWQVNGEIVVPVWIVERVRKR
jgi:hypothetical protein